MPRRPTATLLLGATLLLSAAAGCGSQKGRVAPVAVTASQTRITAALPDDRELDALIEPYRTEFESQMNEILATCPREMYVDRPEGLLGALVADIVLERARAESGLPVQISLQNNGGLRIPWPRGEITLGMVYELMPFDNEIVILRFTGDQVRALANDLAAVGGEPVAGMSFTIRGNSAGDLRVGGEVVGSGDYWVATNDYLAGGGGRLETLWNPQERRGTGVLVRDAIADALREVDQIPVPEMGRIRREER